MRRSLILYTGLAVFVIYYGIHAFRLPMFGDFPVYLAAVHALYVDPWLPAHETMAVQGAHSVWYSPYTVLVAAVGKILQVSPYRALLLAGVANLLLYAGAIVFFFRTFAARPASPWPPLLFLAVTLFLRSENYEWSSETSYQTLRFIQAYPSFLGWPLALIAFALAERVVRGAQGFATLAILTLLIAFLLLSHLITASWVIGIVGLRGLYAVAVAWRPASRQGQMGTTNALREAAATFAKILAALVAAVCLSLLWPYYSLLQLGSFGAVAEGAPFGSQPFHFMLAVYALGLVAAVQAILAGRHLFLIVAFLATMGAWATFRLAGLNYGDRYVFFMAFFPQVLIADAASLAIERVFRRTPDGNQQGLARMGAGIYLAALVAAIIWAPSMHGEWRGLIKSPYLLWRIPAADKVFYNHWEPYRTALKPGDVVMMPYDEGEPAMNLAAVTGARMVAVQFSDDVPDFADRTASVDQFFSRGANAETRLGELRRWHANKIVLVGPTLELEADMEALVGKPLYRDASAIVYGVGR
jgi:hypothetical protein